MKLLNSHFLNEVDLIFILLSTLLCMLFVLVPPLNLTQVRTVFGLILIFFSSGYSLIASLFPKRDDLGGIERFTLSFGLSIIVVPLLGLVLNFTPFGIRLLSLLIVISLFTISLSIVAWVRRLKIPANERFRILDHLLKSKEFFEGKIWDKFLSFLLVTSIITSSVALAYVIAIPKTNERFAEFYLLDANGTTCNYPKYITYEEERKLIIVIVNHEYENVTYRLEVSFNESLIHEEHVFLIDNEKREIHFTFKAIKKGENQKLEFLLYKDQQREVYRELHIWISVK